MVSHTYASLAEFHDFRRASGSQATANVYDDARIVDILESVSRRIDAYCDRGPSGFGPRTGTNRYVPANYGGCLELADDLLLPVTSVTALWLDGTNSRSIASTGYYAEPLNRDQKRRLIETLDTFSGGFLDIVGTWGYQNVTVTSSATTNEALDASETGVDVTSGAVFSPGQTIIVDSEQMYISSISSNTLTVVRGANGTTAATHLTSAAIGIYQYPDEVKDTTLRLALRRWRARDAGADGNDGGVVATVAAQESEDTILRRGVGHLRIMSAG